MCHSKLLETADFARGHVDEHLILATTHTAEAFRHGVRSHRQATLRGQTTRCAGHRGTELRLRPTYLSARTGL